MNVSIIVDCVAIYRVKNHDPYSAISKIEIDDETAEYVLELQRKYAELQRNLKAIYYEHHGEDNGN